MKKKILFVINTLGQAGAENALLNMFPYFDRNQYELYLYVMLNQGELIYDVPEYVHVLNKSPSPLPVLSREGEGHMTKEVMTCFLRHGSGVKNLPDFLSNYKTMGRQGKVQWDKLLWPAVATGAKRFSIEFDLAVAYLEGASTYYVANYVKAKKKVAWVHVDMKLAGYSKALDKECYDAMDRVFCVSSEVREAFLKLHPECEKKALEFENLLDVKKIQRLSEIEKAKELDSNSFCLLTVGRLHPQKGYDLAIETLADLKEKGYPIKWYVVGDGPMKKPLADMIANYHLEDDFIFLGAKKNPYPYFKACDLYVHATRFEGKSLAISEAKTLGKALVVSDVSGNRAQVEERKNGLVCKLEKQDLEDAILSLYKNEELRKQMEESNKKEGLSKKENSLRLLLDLLEE